MALSAKNRLKRQGSSSPHRTQEVGVRVPLAPPRKAPAYANLSSLWTVDQEVRVRAEVGHQCPLVPISGGSRPPVAMLRRLARSLSGACESHPRPRPDFCFVRGERREPAVRTLASTRKQKRPSGPIWHVPWAGEQLFDRLGRGGRASGCGEGPGDSLGARRLAVATSAAARSRAGLRRLWCRRTPASIDLDPARDVELIARERHHAYRHARCERPLGDALATVGDDARRAGEDLAVREEPLEARVRRRFELGRVLGRGRRHERYVLTRECRQRRTDQLGVQLGTPSRRSRALSGGSRSPATRAARRAAPTALGPPAAPAAASRCGGTHKTRLEIERLAARPRAGVLHARARQGAALSSAGGDSLRIRLLTLEGRRITDARREDAQRVHG